MDHQELANIIKKEFPGKAIDITDSLELLRLVINDTMEAVGEKVNESFSEKEFEKVVHYSEVAKEIEIHEKKLEEVINIFDVDDISIEKDHNEEEDKKAVPNYNEYIIDNSVVYTLYENFTHKRPFGFSINNNKIIEVSTWQDMLIKTCEILMLIDSNKFVEFENKRSMNGKKNKYFSKNIKEVRKPRKAGDKIYINTNQSANSIRNLIIKMLKEYKFSIGEFKIYLRADYTNLNEKNI